MSQGFARGIIFGGEVKFSDSANIDAFSRLRVSSPVNLFSAQTQYNAEPLQMETGASGTGVAPTHSANTRMVTLSCTAGNGTCFIQSYQYIPYQPSKSQLIAITGVIGASVAGAVTEVGYFDTANGVIYRQNTSGGLEVVLRSSTSGAPVETTVAQASWNIDPMTGGGPSGVTLDATKSFILIIDLQYLAMGRVRVGFDINGVIYYVHEFLNANVLAVPYMQTATLPVQMLITTTATASTKTAYFKCAAVNSEGGFERDTGYPFSTPEGTVTAASGARTHILSIRPKTTFNAIANRILFRLDLANILVTGLNPVFYELVVGATFSVARTWNDVSATYSSFEYGTGGTYNTGAIVIASGYVSSSATVKGTISTAIQGRFPITLDRAGAVRANGTLSLLVSGIGGTSATRATFDFTETR